MITIFTGKKLLYIPMVENSTQELLLPNSILDNQKMFYINVDTGNRHEQGLLFYILLSNIYLEIAVIIVSNLLTIISAISKWYANEKFVKLKVFNYPISCCVGIVSQVAEILISATNLIRTVIIKDNFCCFLLITAFIEPAVTDRAENYTHEATLNDI